MSYQKFNSNSFLKSIVLTNKNNFAMTIFVEPYTEYLNQITIQYMNRIFIAYLCSYALISKPIFIFHLLFNEYEI